MRRANFNDLIGSTFGRLTVLGLAEKTGRYTKAKCRCECGAESVVRFSFLVNGHTKSCGCLARESFDPRVGLIVKHGHAKRGRITATYITWRAMLTRCLNPNYKQYKDYGGRGISIDPRWLGPSGFQNFIADMGERPVGTWIERNDNDGHYEPDNCSWATPKAQMANQRRRYVLPMAA
jgi:hypothetical protein